MTDEPAPPSDSADDGAGLPINRKALASFGFGIAAFLCLFVFPFGAFALGMPALTTGIHARREITASGAGGDGLAVIGLIVGGAGLLFGVIALGLDSLPRS